MNFSQPYAESGLALAAQKKSTADVKSLADLDNARYTIAAIGGSVAAQFVSQFLPHAKLQAFENADAASEALIGGKVDGYLEDEPVPTFSRSRIPDKIDVPLDRPLLVSKAGFAVNKGDPRLSRVLELVDRLARGRHLAADDLELLVQDAALEG